MGIQSSINSMIGSAAHAIMGVKALKKLGASPQEAAKQIAQNSAANEVTAKKTQRRNFMDYLGKQPTSFGGTVSQLSPEIQKQIASQYTKSQRKAMMDKMDKEVMK